MCKSVVATPCASTATMKMYANSFTVIGIVFAVRMSKFVCVCVCVCVYVRVCVFFVFSCAYLFNIVLMVSTSLPQQNDLVPLDSPSDLQHAIELYDRSSLGQTSLKLLLTDDGSNGNNNGNGNGNGIGIGIGNGSSNGNHHSSGLGVPINSIGSTGSGDGAFTMSPAFGAQVRGE